MADLLEFHSIANIFPLMEGAEYEAFKADIAKRGVIEPIWLHEGKILDGRNRYRAANDEDGPIDYVTQEWTPTPGETALDFVLSLNLHRRHLNESQRAMVAAKIANLGEGRPAKTLQICRVSVKDAANKVNIGERSVRDANKVIREGTKEAVKAVEAGKVAVSKAVREIKREEKRERQDEKKKAAPKHKPRVIVGDCIKELQGVKAGTVRLIFADPPYNIGVDYGDGKLADQMPPADYLEWCEHWMQLCSDRLTPDGSLWVMINDEWADHFGVILRRVGVVRRSWIKWYETFGVNCQTKFNRTSRHIFYCVKDPKDYVFNDEAVRRPSDRQLKYNDKRADSAGKIWDDVWQIPRLVDNAEERIPDFPTQIPLAITRAIVGCASDPGDLVLDPFSGSGSTGVAAVELGRRYIGIEKNEHYAKLSRKRLA